MNVRMALTQLTKPQQADPSPFAPDTRRGARAIPSIMSRVERVLHVVLQPAASSHSQSAPARAQRSCRGGGHAREVSSLVVRRRREPATMRWVAPIWDDSRHKGGSFLPRKRLDNLTLDATPAHTRNRGRPPPVDDWR